MSIKDFQVRDENAKKEMEKNLDSFKLEKTISLWYLVVAKSKATIAGSKN